MCFNAFSAIVKKEVWSHFVSSGTYVFLALGWFSMAVATFYISGFVGANTAHMGTFFAQHPFIFIFLLPALGMSVWASEWQRNTAEKLLTLPLSPFAVLLAKFCGVLAVVLVLLLGTFPMVVSVFYLGEPAIGPIFSGYIGSFFLGAAMLALALMCSLITRSQAAAFSLGLVLLFTLILAGWGVLNRLLYGFVPPEFLALFVEFGLIDRYSAFADGLIHIRDVVFMLSFVGFFIGFSLAILYAKMNQAKQAAIIAISVLVGFVVLNAAVRPLTWRIDMTPNQFFTLHEDSKKQLEKLNAPLNITFYYSKNHQDVPLVMRQYERHITDLLSRLDHYKNVSITVADPLNDREAMYKAEKAGIQQVPLPTGEVMYFGLMVEHGGREIVIPVLDPARQNFLEFDVMSAVVKAKRTKRAKIGILTDLDLGNDETRPRFISELFANYNIHQIRSGMPYFPNDLDLVLVLLTPYMPVESVYALDQYVVQGGKVMMFIDPLLRTAPSPEFLVVDRNADDFKVDHPADLLREWGVLYNPLRVVGDRSMATPVSHANNTGLTTYPMYLYFSPENMNKEHPITTGLQSMTVLEAGTFKPFKMQKGLRYTPLLQTTENGEEINRSFFNIYHTQLLPKYLDNIKSKRDIAFELSGKFSSAFKDLPEEVKYFYEDQVILNPTQKIDAEHHRRTDKESRVVVIGDLDFVSDTYALEYKQMGERQVPTPANDNLLFTFNAIQSLLGETEVMALRAKATDKRTLTRIEEMITDLAASSQKAEEKITTEIFTLLGRQGELERKAQLEIKMDPKLADELKNVRSKKLELESQLRAVRRIFKSEIENLGRVVEGYNLFAMPLLSLIFSGFVYWWRRRLG